MSNYQVLLSSNESTVVSEYQSQPRKSEEYQSEADLEKSLIQMLVDQGYEYLPIHDEAGLIQNLRRQIERLNQFQFTDQEWNRFFKEKLANQNSGIVEKTRIIQEDYVQNLTREDGSTLNVTLLDKKNVHNNFLQVINQYEVEGTYKNRYDVTILVNGLPLVHIELKRRSVPLREAFNQINRYQRDSFWAGSGLFEYVQLFVISNGTNTKYYSNTTRFQHVHGGKKTSNSFEFTSFWADSKNQIIPDLVDFTKTFFMKHTLLNVLTRYCVFTLENMLMVMRPYQIVATEQILNRIEISTNYKQMGTIDAGGYIWHTTGSGKTLTSFKTARLASKLPYIDKVLFVVDRKDLDYQTMKEYDRFEKGAANSNSSTAILTRQLEDDNSKIIITTIQKLSHFIKKNPKHPVYQKHVVIIFDECHRSQFGEMHQAITHCFKNYHLFGFTGTPIFAVNANITNKNHEFTTEQLFGKQLHAYTIVDAINDQNVLPFRIDYIKTMDADEQMEDEKVWDIAREQAMMAPERIQLITQYILKHFDQKTYRNGKAYTVSTGADAQHMVGFNSILAVSSIQMAKLYYKEFQKQMAAGNSEKLKVAVIFSYGVNEDEELLEENPEDTNALDQPSRDFLEAAIQDYNTMFHTNYDTSADKFQNYYKDVSFRMKNREIDLLIVVNMFLTGFDAPTLNTLWVDKNLKMHGLIQAFSRTNRILNSVKKFGNIVCFRNLQYQVNEAIALFGDKEANGIVLMKKFSDYYDGYTDQAGETHQGYVGAIEELQRLYPLSKPRIEGEESQHDFITLFGHILRMKNFLQSFDDFKGKELLTEREFQDYMGRYQDLYEDYKKNCQKGDVVDVTNDIVFELELIRQEDINIDYILSLVSKYHDSHREDKEMLLDIQKAVESSPELRSKKDLILAFVNGLDDEEDILSQWHFYSSEAREFALSELIQKENLRDQEARDFIKNAFRSGELNTAGTEFDRIMPPVSRFFSEDREEKKRRVAGELEDFFAVFFGI